MYDFLGTDAARAPRKRRIPVGATGVPSTSTSTANNLLAPASRDETLATARAERERRARLKAEAAAALRIQVRIELEREREKEREEKKRTIDWPGNNGGDDTLNLSFSTPPPPQSFWRGRRGAAHARAAVRTAWIETYGQRCEKTRREEGAATAATYPPLPLVAGVAFFADPTDPGDAAALAGACAALAAGSPLSLSALSPAAGASLCRKAAEALWQHRGGAAVAAELAAPRGSFNSGGGGGVPSSSSTSPSSSPLPSPFATPLAEAMMALADPSFWIGKQLLLSQQQQQQQQQQGATAAAQAALEASAGSRKGRLLSRAATLLPPPREMTTATTTETAATAANSSPPPPPPPPPPPSPVPSLAAALISNLAVRSVALGGRAASANANQDDDLSALLCTPALWARAPPLAPLAPRLSRAAAAAVAAAVGDSLPAGSPAAAAALSDWLTPLLKEKKTEGSNNTKQQQQQQQQRWSVPGGLGAASAALAANLASSAGRAVSSLPSPSSPSSSSSPAAEKSLAVAALCRALACLLRASPPEALGEKREKRGSLVGYFDASGGGGGDEEEEDQATTSEDEDDDEIEGDGGNGSGAATPMETSTPSLASSSSSSPYLPLDLASLDPRCQPPAGLSSLSDAAGFLGPLIAAALPAATAAEAEQQQQSSTTSDPSSSAAASAAAPWALCEALLSIMALPSRRLATLAALASGGIAVVPRLWFSSARGSWREALSRASKTSGGAGAASSVAAASSSVAAGLVARDPRALSVLAVLSAAAATSFSTAAPDAPAAGRLLPVEELFSGASPSSSSSSSSSAIPPGSGLLDLARDVAWSILSGEGSAVEEAATPFSSRKQQQQLQRQLRETSTTAGGEKGSSNASPLAAAALGGVASLLRILHDRNGMVPFAPEEAFHAAPLRRGEGEGPGGEGGRRGGRSGDGGGDGGDGSDEEMDDGDEDEEEDEEEGFEGRAGTGVFDDRGVELPFHSLHGRSRRPSSSVASDAGAGAASRFRGNRLRSVLRRAPCLVPFRERAAAFVDALALDAERSSGGMDALALGGGGGRTAARDERQRRQGGGMSSPPRFAVVRRGHVFEDALSTLGPLPPNALKGRVRVVFVDEFGMQEAGVDGGGLFKEFCEALVKEAFWPREEAEEEVGVEPPPQLPPPPHPPFPCLFVETPSRELAPAPGAGRDRASAARLSFLGRFLGKLLSEGVLVELPLARFFVKQLLGRQPDLGDLGSLDPALAASLAALRRASAEEIEAAGLTFSIGMQRAAVVGRSSGGGNGSGGSGGSGGESRVFEQVEVDLVPDGSGVPVTAANVAEFVHRAAAAHFSAAAPAAAALRSGLESFLPRSWPRRAFSASEFSILLGGGRNGVSVEDMRRHAVYAGGYHPRHPTILALWQALREMTDEERSLVLRFVTACGRPPLLGFSRLQPKLCIAMSGGGGGAEEATSGLGRLPSAATCMNLLKLPPYGGSAEVKNKLLYAASEAGGFSLS